MQCNVKDKRPTAVKVRQKVITRRLFYVLAHDREIGVRFLPESRDFSFPQSVQASLVDLPSFYSVDTRDLSQETCGRRVKLITNLYPMTTLRNRGAILHPLN